MRELSQKEIETIKAGKGFSITGALFKGIADIVNAIGNYAGTTITGIYMFVDRNNHHAKATYKMGNNMVSYDDTEKFKLESKQTQEDSHQLKLVDQSKEFDMNKVHKLVSEDYGDMNYQHHDASGIMDDFIQL